MIYTQKPKKDKRVYISPLITVLFTMVLGPIIGGWLASEFGIPTVINGDPRYILTPIPFIVVALLILLIMLLLIPAKEKSKKNSKKILKTTNFYILFSCCYLPIRRHREI